MFYIVLHSLRFLLLALKDFLKVLKDPLCALLWSCMINHIKQINTVCLCTLIGQSQQSIPEFRHDAAVWSCLDTAAHAHLIPFGRQNFLWPPVDFAQDDPLWEHK